MRTGSPARARRLVPGALALILGAAAMVLPALPARADTPSVFVAGGDSLSIWVAVDWEHPLPTFIQERLDRGLPATVGIRADLIRTRSVWSDAKLTGESLELQVVKDPWDSSYQVLDDDSTRTLDSLGDVQATLSRQRLRLVLRPEWCDQTSVYRVEVATSVAPLTSRDAGEVDSWLRGQLRGLGRGLLGIPRGLFSVIRDLSGLGERTSRGESARFRIEMLPDERVKVVIPGGG